MKKLCLVVSLAGTLITTNLFGGMVTLVDNTSLYSYGNGGEFRAVGDAGLNNIVNWNAYSTATKGTTSDAIDGGSWGYNSGLAVAGHAYFQTFCIEFTEEFSPGGQYSVSTSDHALYGHVGGSPGVPITIGTAWLYSHFASGALAGPNGFNAGYDYTYGANRSASAGALQQAIWWLQGETGGVDNSWVDLVSSHYADPKAAANGAFNVKALNLGDPGQVQDQLVIVPEPTTMVAGALLLLPFAASTLRSVRRSRPA
jgi:hypothetical protein